MAAGQGSGHVRSGKAERKLTTHTFTEAVACRGKEKLIPGILVDAVSCHAKEKSIPDTLVDAESRRGKEKLITHTLVYVIIMSLGGDIISYPSGCRVLSWGRI